MRGSCGTMTDTEGERMTHKWQFSEMWRYFDYNEMAIYKYSEEIAKLPEQEREAVYKDIAGRIRGYVEYLLPQSEKLYQFAVIVYNDLYRTMCNTPYYSWRQTEYLHATVLVVTDMLIKHGITVHFASNNVFGNPCAIKTVFPLMWRECGLHTVDIYTIVEKLSKKELNTNEDLMGVYDYYRAEAGFIARMVIEEMNKNNRSYALIIPDGDDVELEYMLNTIGKPGVMNILKLDEGTSSRVHTFDFIPPQKE